MRLAYLVHQYLPDSVGGTEIYTHGLARRALGHPEIEDVLVLCYEESPAHGDFVPRESRHEGIRVVRLPYNLSTAPNRVRYEYDNPVLGVMAKPYLEEFRPDVVHATHLMKLSLSCAQVALELGARLWLTATDYWMLCPRHTLLRSDGNLCRGPRPSSVCAACLHATHGAFASEAKSLQENSPLLAGLKLQWAGIRGRLGEGPQEELAALSRRLPAIRDLAERATGILVLTRFLHEQLLRFGFPETSLHLLPHGIETDEAPEIPRTRTSQFRLAFVGSLVEHKGPHLPIDAVRRLDRDRFPDVRLTLHGPLEPETPYLRKLRKRAEGDPRIHFAGGFPPEDLPRVLSEVDALLVPAQWYENGPLIVKQALSLRIPVIASRLGSLPEMIPEPGAGLLLPHDDVSAWESAVAFASEQWQRGESPWAGGILPGSVPTVPTADQHFASVFQCYRGRNATASS